MTTIPTMRIYSAAAERNDCVRRTVLEEAYWCKCSNCVTMESELNATVAEKASYF